VNNKRVSKSGMEDQKDGTLLGGGSEWLKEDDSTYTKYMCIHYRDGRIDRHIMESGLSEKEYFKRRLDGSD